MSWSWEWFSCIKSYSKWVFFLKKQNWNQPRLFGWCGDTCSSWNGRILLLVLITYSVVLQHIFPQQITYVYNRTAGDHSILSAASITSDSDMLWMCWTLSQILRILMLKILPLISWFPKFCHHNIGHCQAKYKLNQQASRNDDQARRK